jgi:P-type Mg2+ transporter
MNILCIDKIGTLTIDRIILERHLDILGNADDSVLRYAYLNSYFQTGLKNLLDAAILAHGELHEALHIGESYRKVDELPFDFGRRRMSVIVEEERQQHELICKRCCRRSAGGLLVCQSSRRICPIVSGTQEFHLTTV